MGAEDYKDHFDWLADELRHGASLELERPKTDESTITVLTLHTADGIRFSCSTFGNADSAATYGLLDYARSYVTVRRDELDTRIVNSVDSGSDPK